MPKISRIVGATSQILQLFIQNSSSTTGAGIAGISTASTGLICNYMRDTDTAPTAISLVNMTIGTYTSGGFKVINNTSMPGDYQFCVPNAALAAGASSVICHLFGSTNMADLLLEIDLDQQSDVRQWNGSAVTTPNTPGFPVVDVMKVSGATVSTSLAQFGVNMVSPTTTQVLTINGSLPGALNGLMLAGTNSAVTVAALAITGAFTATNGSNDVRVNMVSPTTTQILTINGSLPGGIKGLMVAGPNSALAVDSLTVTGATGLNGGLTVSGAVLFNSSFTVSSLTVSTVLVNSLTVSGIINATNAANQIIGVSAATVSAGQMLTLTIAAVTGSVGSVAGAVNSVNAGVAVSTNADKTGYSVSTVGDKTNYTITSNIKKNQALNNYEFLVTDSVNHAPLPGLGNGGVTVTRSIDGGAFGGGTLSATTEIGSGIYAVNFGSGDLNGNVIVLQGTAVGADAVYERIVTQP